MFPSFSFPLELVKIICDILQSKILVKISSENPILESLNEKRVKTYIEKIGGINGLILDGDLSGVKYCVKNHNDDKNVNNKSNNNYAIKWARLCGKNDIVEYLTELPIRNTIEEWSNEKFDIVKKYRNNSPNKIPREISRMDNDYYSIKLKPIHIDNIRDIQWFNIDREFACHPDRPGDITYFRDMGQKDWYNIFSKILNDNKNRDESEKKSYGYHTLIKNLNIKYSNGNIPLSIMANHQILYEWNSEDILKEIIPIGYSPYICFLLHMNGFQIPPEEYPKFTVNYDIGFLPLELDDYYDYFLFNSTIARYDIPKGITLPVETFGKNANSGAKVYNLIHLYSGLIGLTPKYLDFLDERFPYEYPSDTSKDCIEYISHQCYPVEIIDNAVYGDSLKRITERIILYGKMCLPYDII